MTLKSCILKSLHNKEGNIATEGRFCTSNWPIYYVLRDFICSILVQKLLKTFKKVKNSVQKRENTAKKCEKSVQKCKKKFKHGVNDNMY